jgi:hypothetical protein
MVAPREVVLQQRTADEVHVVRIAIVGRTNGDDRLECGRASRGDLQSVEPAPGYADHADRTRAPGLSRDPGDELHGIVLLLFEVFVP